MQDYFAIEIQLFKKRGKKDWRDLVSSFAVLFGELWKHLHFQYFVNLTQGQSKKNLFYKKANSSRPTVWFTLLGKGRIDCKSEEAVLNDTKLQKRSRSGLLCNRNVTLKDRRDLVSQSWSWQMILLWHTKWKRNLPINQQRCIDSC